MKILIIEDERNVAEALCRLLTSRMEFVECKIVTTLAEGKIESIVFEADITVCDILLDGSTKEEVLEAIRDHSIRPPVVVVSALIEHDPDLAAMCWAYGAKGVLSKKGLLDKIDSIQGIIQKARFIDAVTGSHLRNTAPQQLKEIQNGHACLS